MITPSFSITATERVLPAMALDFTTASLDSRVTFTRTGNTATCVNSSGFVAIVNANLPRFDYNPITLACKGLLIEESRQNVLLQSENFSTTWYNTESSELVNVITSPSNTLTGDKLVENSALNFHAIQQDVASVSLSSYTFSVFGKYGERNIQLWFGYANVAGNPVANFDLQNGVLGTTSGSITSTIENYGNGWYKCSATVTSAVAVAFSCFIGLTTSPSAARNQIYQGDGTSGAYLWGAQLELGAFGTSYIPTTTAAVTRNVDVASMTSTNFSSWYTATTGAAVVWAIPQTATGTRPLIQFDDTTANEIITLRGNVADPEMYIVDGGVAQAQIDTGTIVANTAYKLSGAWNTNLCAAAKDGGTVGTDTSATMPTPTQLRIGSDGTNYASAWVQKIMYWKQRIINAEVQAISK